jgi:putative DNA methylase
VLAEQEGEFDADTRWALAWFDQNGFNEGAYGVAETLCTAKNTSVQGMKDAGILKAQGGKVRLLKKEELDADWNPATDSRLTIWEITHHLIRRLEQGESGAAELIRQLGAKAEVARDLSYRLYTICERVVGDRLQRARALLERRATLGGRTQSGSNPEAGGIDLDDYDHELFSHQVSKG